MIELRSLDWGRKLGGLLTQRGKGGGRREEERIRGEGRRRREANSQVISEERESCVGQEKERKGLEMEKWR